MLGSEQNLIRKLSAECHYEFLGAAGTDSKFGRAACRVEAKATYLERFCCGVVIYVSLPLLDSGE